MFGPFRGDEMPHVKVTSGRVSILALAAMFSLPLPVFSQHVQVFVSSQAGERLAARPVLSFETRSLPPGQGFAIDDTVRYQKIDGFGASFQEAGLMSLNVLPVPQQEAVLQALFDPQKGAGFSAMKTVLASTDFMTAGPFYSYDPTPGDVQMKDFSVARDLGPNGLITFIKRARRYGSFVLQAPMDYPPDWMLFNVKTNQDVNPKYYDALALYYLRYLQQYAGNGVFIDYLSLFNEPDIYTKIPYQEINILLRDHVAPLFAREKIRTRIMPSEAPARDDASRNYPLLLADPITRKSIAVLPYHGYGYQDYDKMAAIHRQYPQFPLWMTEVCYAYEAGTPRSMPLPRYDFADGDFWGNEIFNDLEASSSAWIYWNLILNQAGGPWSVSPVHGNPDPNVQQPVVIIDARTGKVSYTGLYYYLAHFSKFVRPGAVRIKTTGSVPGVRVLSFVSPQGTIVTEIMNRNAKETEVDLAYHARTLHLRLPAISISTAIWQP
jgi:glucosylceramidase